MNSAIKLPNPTDKIVADFLQKINSIVPKFVEGLYLTGSIAMNDFYLNKSDIDFIVLCKKLPDEKIACQLKYIHRAIAKRYSHPNLNGTYLAFDSLQTVSPEEIKTLTYQVGRLGYGTFDMAPTILTELKTNSISILGQNSETLPIDIERSDLNNFLYKNINSYWKKWIKRYSSPFIGKLLLLSFPRLTEWSVLGVARQLCTLQTGKIVSKTEAGIYCIQQLPESFHSILSEAIEIRQDNRTYPFIKSHAIRPSFRRLTQTIQCVNYIIDTFNKTYNESSQ